MTVFVDTNVLVCARDDLAGEKKRHAEAWMAHVWGTRSGRISTQVLNEFYNTVTRKLRQPMSKEHAQAEIRDLVQWDPVIITPALLEIAWRVEDRYGLSWWDSMVVAAAQLVDANYLLTEDMQDGQDLGGVVVLNPFLHDPASV